MDSLDLLFQVFLLIFVVGSSVAGWLKKRRDEQAAPPRRPPVRPSEFEAFLPEPVLPEPRPEPPPSPRPQAGPPADEAVGGLRSALEDHRLETEGVGRTTISTLSAELDRRRLGELRATGPAEFAATRAWRPAGSWREAVIVREVLGPPVSLRPPGDLSFLS
ncbi:MAG: hypothetical protein D6702_11740 [Planctomycetota bacterium]|nr:MAG: hypothetical protein D6702_11740 [Planctomycetota bacterium]